MLKNTYEGPADELLEQTIIQQTKTFGDIFTEFSSHEIQRLLIKHCRFPNYENIVADYLTKYSPTENSTIAYNIWKEAVPGGNDPDQTTPDILIRLLVHVGINVTERRVITAIKNAKGIERKEVVLRGSKTKEVTMITREDWFKIYEGFHDEEIRKDALRGLSKVNSKVEPLKNHPTPYDDEETPGNESTQDEVEPPKKKQKQTEQPIASSSAVEIIDLDAENNEAEDNYAEYNKAEESIDDFIARYNPVQNDIFAEQIIPQPFMPRVSFSSEPSAPKETAKPAPKKRGFSGVSSNTSSRKQMEL